MKIVNTIIFTICILVVLMGVTFYMGMNFILVPNIIKLESLDAGTNMESVRNSLLYENSNLLHVTTDWAV